MTTSKCPHCGEEINPASLLASRPRKRSAEAAEQSRQAAKHPRKRKETRALATQEPRDKEVGR